MSLVLNALPDPHTQLRSLQQKLLERQERIEELEDQLRNSHVENKILRDSVSALRDTLHPLYHSMQILFGHIEAAGVNESAAPVSPAKKQVWESWKQKLGGLTAKAIDVLQMHGPMNQTQLRIQLSCASRSVTNIVAALNKAGLINKADGKIALKDI